MHRSVGVWSDSTPQFGEPMCTSLPAAEGVESLHTPANGLICPHLRQAKKSHLQCRWLRLAAEQVLGELLVKQSRVLFIRHANDDSGQGADMDAIGNGR
ncbi:hypothetical protein C8C94_5002 [Acidovorax sp. 94]|nr:hypothetical protein C8C94_5002 [Acidovorax sp. 94]